MPRSSPDRQLERALDERRILAVCGAGGVGKTTTAAALAVEAARRGRRVLVCTIDPARRLATSLGLLRLPGEPRSVSLARVAPGARGSLAAMTLDTKRTFDALVERYAGGEEARRRILGNHVYQQISAAVAGSHEYMAMEKLLDLSRDDRFDLVVLDTPPTRHALDFLDAPDRLLGFLDTSVLRFFLRPYFAAGRLTLKVATRTGALALRLADRLLGLQFLQDMSEFFLAFESMYDGFQERAGKVHDLLRDPGSGFVVVAGPRTSALDQARFFHARLREKGMPFVAFVVNRVHRHPRPFPRSRLGDPALAEALGRIVALERTVARAEARELARFEAETREAAVLLEEREGDVHDLRGLVDVADGLFSRARVRPGRRAAAVRAAPAP
jgi:anion-transporting  ArsA/GET3 family ATPase